MGPTTHLYLIFCLSSLSFSKPNIPHHPALSSPNPCSTRNESPMSSNHPNHRSSTTHSQSNPPSSNKQKRPVRLTFESLRAHDAIEKPRSSIKRFASSNTDSHGRFAATGSSNRRALEVERGLKAEQRGVFGSNGKVAESSKKSQAKDVKKKDTKQNDTKQQEGQSNRDQDRWGGDECWYRD